ncbi:hypothetical protein Q31b_27200 [Novipirellula aureliae]|uniref:Uncharacterized protein n=1 Tax=Novipirellula aureliae TaxID=2527966 RepID=A0A5C6E0V2_9BACT|nr:hypothetical protein [Novipirellula aureliae]TWU41281.1 hypothetical protein Q31b_27200 [Novipirellula aureliae]
MKSFELPGYRLVGRSVRKLLVVGTILLLPALLLGCRSIHAPSTLWRKSTVAPDKHDACQPRSFLGYHATQWQPAESFGAVCRAPTTFNEYGVDSSGFVISSDWDPVPPANDSADETTPSDHDTSLRDWLGSMER